MGDWSTMITSSISSLPRIFLNAPGASDGSPFRRRSPRYSTSSMSVDLPDPLTPEMPTTQPRGICTSMLLRLCSHAPVISIALRRSSASLSSSLGATDLFPDKYAAVDEVRDFNSLESVPEKTTSPPREPGPGPMSITRSAARISSGSCSTTSRVLPASRSR